MIQGTYRDDEAVPQQAIRGARQVDQHGNITGPFVPNPAFDPPRDR